MSISTIPYREEVARIPYKIQCERCHKEIDITFPSYSPKDFSRQSLAFTKLTKWCPHCEAAIVVKAYYGLTEDKQPCIERIEMLDPAKQRVPKEMPRGLTVKCKNKRPVRAAED